MSRSIYVQHRCAKMLVKNSTICINKKTCIFSTKNYFKTIYFFNIVKKLAERMDPTVKPCDDFYQFVCGTSINSTNSESSIYSSEYAFEGIAIKSRKGYSCK